MKKLTAAKRKKSPAKKIPMTTGTLVPVTGIVTTGVLVAEGRTGVLVGQGVAASSVQVGPKVGF